jgi:hypothetical protein
VRISLFSDGREIFRVLMPPFLVILEPESSRIFVDGLELVGPHL